MIQHVIGTIYSHLAYCYTMWSIAVAHKSYINENEREGESKRGREQERQRAREAEMGSI